MFNAGDIVDYCGSYVPEEGMPPEWLGMTILGPHRSGRGYGVRFEGEEAREYAPGSYPNWFETQHLKLVSASTRWEDLLIDSREDL